MNVLIITAHPSPAGFTHSIAREYARGSQEKGNQTEITDLYNCSWSQDFLRFENPESLAPEVNRERWQNKIADADEIVFIFPLWWWDAPAILKNFFDCNFSSGFAYKYNKGLPVGLLKQRTARLFITCDAPALLYRIMGSPFRTIWMRGRLRFCGIKVKDFVIFDRMINRNAQDKERFLRKAYKIGRS